MALVNPTPAPAPAPVAQLPGWFLGLFAAMCLAVVALFAVVLYDRKQPVPAPVSDPIPADLMAYLVADVNTFRTVGKKFQGAVPKPDRATFQAAIAAAQNAANEKLMADIMAGDPGTNSIGVGDALAKILKVK